MNFITSDVVTGLELVSQNAIEKWRNLIGPTNSTVAKEQKPNSIRALYGTDGTKNAVHGSDSGPSNKREGDIFFGPASPMRTTAIQNNCSCVIIKPHVVASG